MTLEPVPLRPDEQVAGGYLHVTLGGQLYELSVLPMRDSRKWVETLRATVRQVLAEVGPVDDLDDFVGLLANNAEAEMDLLIAYDALGAKVLPEREWIDAHATDRECYNGLKRVTAATYPFGPDLLRIVPELMPMLMQAVSRGVATAATGMAISRRMSSARRSTAGRRATSKPTSPTSSSRSTSKRRSSAGAKPTSPN